MESSDKIKIVTILGPTSSGKTELAVRLAEKCGGEIVNADSMQVYRGMDIGTAKPSKELCNRVPHHLIDIVDPDEEFSASDFRREAERAIQDISSRGNTVFVVGGTGLYIKALLKGLVDSPRGGGLLRRSLQDEARLLGGELLLQRLWTVDPVTAAGLHQNDQVRIIRALEVYLQTGCPLSQFRSEHGFGNDYYNCLKIGISIERGELYRRVEERVESMMTSGFLEEVESLKSRGFSADIKPFRAIGYKELLAHLSGQMSLFESVELIKRNTRRYAKRQVTWFKKDSQINWVEYPVKFDTIYNNVIEFFA